MSHKIFGYLAVISSLLLSTPVWSQDWIVDSQRSSVGIVSQNPFGEITGTINKWNGKIEFDPDHLDKSHVIINIDTGSIQTADYQWTHLLPQPDWLSSQAFPTATFEATSFSYQGGNAYEAMGTVVIRGIRRNISLPFTFDRDGQTARAQGMLSLLRTDFNIGGVLENTRDMSIMVGVKFDLTATH
jgi:polyisoprenoid-binding protein YceI